MSVPVSEAVVGTPHGPARAVAAAYHGYRQVGVPPARHLGLPSPFLTLIFTLDEPLHVAQHVSPDVAPGDYRALVGGLHTRPAVIEHLGAQSGIQVQLSPLGAPALLGMPAGELAGLDVAAEDVLGPRVVPLLDRLAGTPAWADRFAVLDEVFAVWLDLGRQPAETVCRAWDLLVRSGGTASVSTLAREVGLSPGHLTRRVSAEIGLSPKVAARVARFDRARRLLPGTTGAAAAAQCGYADQAHFVRDFVSLAGLTPTAWLRAEAGNVQATPAGDEAP